MASAGDNASNTSITVAATVEAAAAIESMATAAGLTTADIVPAAAVSTFSVDVGALAATTTVRFCSSPPPGTTDTGNGNVTTVVNDVDPVGRSTGDVVSVTFNACVQGSRTTNGSATHTIVALTGTPGAGVFTLNTTGTSDMTITTVAGNTIARKGSSTTNETSDGVTTTRAVKSNSTANVTGTVTDTSTQSVDMTSTTNAATNTFTHQSTLTSSSATGGAHNVTTPTPLSGTIGAPPSAGVIVIKHTPVTGAPSVTKITAQAGGTVLLEIDSNGDGVVDTTTTTTWIGLIGLGVGPTFGGGPGLLGGRPGLAGGPARPPVI